MTSSVKYMVFVVHLNLIFVNQISWVQFCLSFAQSECPTFQNMHAVRSFLLKLSITLAGLEIQGCQWPLWAQNLWELNRPPRFSLFTSSNSCLMIDVFVSYFSSNYEFQFITSFILCIISVFENSLTHLNYFSFKSAIFPT